MRHVEEKCVAAPEEQEPQDTEQRIHKEEQGEVVISGDQYRKHLELPSLK